MSLHKSSRLESKARCGAAGCGGSCRVGLGDVQRQGPAIGIGAVDNRAASRHTVHIHDLQGARALHQIEIVLVAPSEQTQQQQQELLERARREIQGERDRAILELRREAVDLALAGASKRITLGPNVLTTPFRFPAMIATTALPSAAHAQAQAGELTLAMANSTCDAMNKVEALYRATRPVRFTYICKSSGLLAKGLSGGALKADVFVSADRDLVFS